MKKRILIAVENAIINLDLKRKIVRSGYDTESVDLISRKNVKNADLIILSESFSNSHICRELIEEYKKPYIYLTSDHTLEKDNYLKMPFLDDELFTIIDLVFDQGKEDPVEKIAV